MLITLRQRRRRRRPGFKLHGGRNQFGGHQQFAGGGRGGGKNSMARINTSFFLVFLFSYGGVGGEAAARYLELVKAQREVQDLGELLGQRLLPLQVLSGVVVSLAGQSSQQAVQRRLWRGRGEPEI